MDVGSLIADLKNEAERISRAIAALTGLGASKPGTKRKARASRGPASKKKSGGGMTAAGRKRLSMLMKKRWAERKKKGSARL